MDGGPIVGCLPVTWWERVYPALHTWGNENDGAHTEVPSLGRPLQKVQLYPLSLPSLFNKSEHLPVLT